jgi:hypothetical protein
MKEFSDAALFYVPGNEVEITPITAFEGNDNFLYMKSHVAKVVGCGEAGKRQEES